MRATSISVWKSAIGVRSLCEALPVKARTLAKSLTLAKIHGNVTKCLRQAPNLHAGQGGKSFFFLKAKQAWCQERHA